MYAEFERDIFAIWLLALRNSFKKGVGNGDYWEFLIFRVFKILKISTFETRPYYSKYDAKLNLVYKDFLLYLYCLSYCVKN